MTGVNLDTIGIIVGVFRNVADVILSDFFGYMEELPNTTYYYDFPFGELSDPGAGARFYELGESYIGTNVLNDPEFRLLIKTKIAKNSSTGTPENVLASLRVLLNSNDVHIIDSGGMEFAIRIGRNLTAVELALIQHLDVLPRPAGVHLYQIVTPAHTYSL